MEYKTLFSPMNIGNCKIKNRIVMSPMLMGFGQFDGTATEQLMDYYEERAKGGTGLIITEITRVNDKHGAAAFAQLAMSHDYQIEQMAEFANRIHRHGAKLFVQLHHPGRQNVGMAVGTVPICIKATKICKSFPKMLFSVAPKIAPVLSKYNLTMSSVAPSKCEPSYFAGGKVRALSNKEIKQLIQQFVDGAVRCKKAGVDGVQLHGTHGYLIQQFLSPNTNQRDDEYGGSFKNRLRFLKEIVEGIRNACGDYPIIVRLTLDEFYDKIGKTGKGYTIEDGLKYAKAIEEMGVDAIDVSSAAYDTFNYWLEPTSFDLGWRKYLAAEVKKIVKIPVIAANLIRSAEQAEQQLQEGTQDFVSLGRPHIADPHWACKVKEGREDEIKRCICCLYCIQSMQDNAYVGGHGYCSVNPTVGAEKEFENIQQDGDGRVVVIVGAGVGGLTAAEMLARRGFMPIVLEKEDKIGGQINLASAPPKKEKLAWCVEDMYANAIKCGAQVKLGVGATTEEIAKYNPYAVIVSTGAVAVKPTFIKGNERENVYTTTQILSGEVALENQNIAVVGSGMTGLETAEMLVENGNKVTIIEMADTIAPGTWMQHVDDAKQKLDKADTQYITSAKLCEIDDRGVVLQPVKWKKAKTVDVGEAYHLNFDGVVLSLGAKSVNTLGDALKATYGDDKVFVIGDAVKVGRIADATSQAYDVAMHKIN